MAFSRRRYGSEGLVKMLTNFYLCISNLFNQEQKAQFHSILLSLLLGGSKVFQYFGTCKFEVRISHDRTCSSCGLWLVSAVVSSIVVVSALRRCALLHFMGDLKVAQMNVQRSLIGEIML